MKNTFLEFISKSHHFPQKGFGLKNHHLSFNNISLKHLIQKHGTPLKIMYLPRIAEQIKNATNLFNKAIKKYNYKGNYQYCYCTKSNHYSQVVEYALKQGVQLETSSSFDIDLIYNLFKKGEVKKDITIINNGYKTNDYLNKILKLYNNGFKNIIVVLDAISEIERLKKLLKTVDGKIKVGIRMATNQKPHSAYQTSRLGIRCDEILDFYKFKIKDAKQLELKMLHFFIDDGINDDKHYWSEFTKAVGLYIELKKICPSLNAINLGGGFPVRNSLSFQYNFENITNKIVEKLIRFFKNINIGEPDIYTEFGKYTVGESGAVIFEVLDKKQQNNNELWYIIDNSLMSTIPDIYTIQEKFIALPINKWNNAYSNVNIGGLSCDYYDFYNTGHLNKKVHLPIFSKKEKEPLYIGFFHTGAYQDSLTGYNGVKHCLIPSPKLIFIDVDEKGNSIETVFKKATNSTDTLKILGYE